jgi:hypothetical protein
MAYRNKRYVINDEGRECTGCGVFRLWDEFAKSKRGAHKHQARCKDCFRAYVPGRKKKKEYLITDEGRECSECGQFKLWANFHKRRDLSTGYASACKQCRKKRTRRDMENGSIRNRELRRKYGIGLAEYEALVKKQGDACAICETTDKGIARGKIRYWSVDHDHKTGEVRALLCQKCNAMLGLANDDIEVLKKMILYLQKWQNIG